MSRRRRRASKEIVRSSSEWDQQKNSCRKWKAYEKFLVSNKCWNILLTRIIKILSSSFSARSAPGTARKMCKHSLKLVGYFQHFLILLENVWMKFPTNSLVRSFMSCFGQLVCTLTCHWPSTLDGQEWRAMISLQHHTHISRTMKQLVVYVFHLAVMQKFLLVQQFSHDNFFHTIMKNFRIKFDRDERAAWRGLNSAAAAVQRESSDRFNRIVIFNYILFHALHLELLRAPLCEIRINFWWEMVEKGAILERIEWKTVEVGNEWIEHRLIHARKSSSILVSQLGINLHSQLLPYRCRKCYFRISVENVHFTVELAIFGWDMMETYSLCLSELWCRFQLRLHTLDTLLWEI